MENHKVNPEIVDYDSSNESDNEFSDAIEKQDVHDDFFDVPEWREENKKEDSASAAAEVPKETEATIEDRKEQILKQRSEAEEKLSEEERLAKKSQALDLKKSGNELIGSGSQKPANA